ncbi:MAG: hypothetical protein LBQ27_06485, partial [Clostridiales bacterium]|nr:hypothetical protein [Clostridiales bacterium]
MFKKFKKNAIAGGLSTAAVGESRRLYGENVISQKKRKGFFLRLLENFGDP